MKLTANFFKVTWSNVSENPKLAIWVAEGDDEVSFIMRMPNIPFKTRLFCFGDAEGIIRIGVTYNDPWSECGSIICDVSNWDNLMITTVEGGMWDNELYESRDNIATDLIFTTEEWLRRKVTDTEKEYILEFLYYVFEHYVNSYSDETIIKLLKNKME